MIAQDDTPTFEQLISKLLQESNDKKLKFGKKEKTKCF
jgi:hypothetical protein